MAKKSGKGEKQGKVLRRSSENRVVLGVLGGIAEYLNADPLHVRIAWWLLILSSGIVAGMAAYALIPSVLTVLAMLYAIAYLLMNEPPAR